ncbi:MAG: hypothetical protein K6E10_09965 [Eubacterium sp.]|nr:hypothetical protein [Eubacterium sp.]
MNIFTLTKLELINFLGINELRHVKNPAVKKQKGFMLGVLIVLYACLAGYVVMQTMLLAELKVLKYIPVLFFALAGMINLVVGIYRAKASIYRESDLDMVSAFPLSGVGIVMSRVFRMYFDNMIVGAAVIIPSMLIYGIKAGCKVPYFVLIIPACIISPILPTAIAAWVGIIFAAIIARNRHKVLTEVVLALVFVIGSFAVSGIITSKAGVGTVDGLAERKDINAEINAEMSRLISQRMVDMEKGFPPVRIMENILKNADFGGLVVYGLISLMVLVITVIVIGRLFFSISRRLFTRQVHRDYRLHSLSRESVRTALVKKEAARYFSSGIYVSNTIMGPVMALIFAISLGFVDIDKILNSAGKLPIDLNAYNAIPYILGLIYCMMSITASSVSIEGKNWWIVRSMPLSAKDILGAKLIFNLIFVAPFYGLMEIIMLFTVNAGPFERIWLILIPGISILYSVLFGLFCNLKFPKFNWENETEVVKQGAAVGISMVGVLPLILLTGGAAVITGPMVHFLNIGYIIVMSIICLLIYSRINKFDLP